MKKAITHVLFTSNLTPPVSSPPNIHHLPQLLQIPSPLFPPSPLHILQLPHPSHTQPQSPLKNIIPRCARKHVSPLFRLA
ncbi:hypothetical protein BC829DRAFT_399991, partial [Chytridium lagenaria]